MVDNFAYGQQGPNDSSTDYAAAVFLIRQMTARMNTMKLVLVKAVHSDGLVAAAGTVDVQPMVSQVDGNNNAVKHGTVYGIPWFRLQGGLNAVICDPQVGDIGYVVVADRDISNVKKTKALATPGSFRRFDLADGIYVGGVLNPASTQYVLFDDTEGIKVVSSTKVTVEVGSSTVTLLPTSVIMAFGANNITIDTTGIHFNGPMFFNGVGGSVSGTVDFGSAILKTTGAAQVGSVASTAGITSATKNVGSTHTHSGVTTGGGTSGPPV